MLGIGGAFASSALDPRLRREEQLRELYSLPILARVPKEKRAPTFTLGKRRLGIGPRERERRALPPGELSAATLESFRTLRTMLAAQRREDGNSRSILVTGPSPSEGKTTTAINLASSLALAGNRVILIEADFRRPTVGEALGVRARVGIGDVLLGNVALEDALVLAPPFGDNLCALLVDRADDWLAEVLSLPAAEALLEDAKRLADYVVLDSPPLTQVIDAMPLARQVDDVVLVCRLGSSNLTPARPPGRPARPERHQAGRLRRRRRPGPGGVELLPRGAAAPQRPVGLARQLRAEDVVVRIRVRLRRSASSAER